MRHGLAAALSLALCAAAPAARAACVLGKTMSLPVTMVGYRPTVEVKLDGKPVRLEADSGAFFSTLSPAATAELGLKTYPAPFGLRLVGINGEAADVQLTKVKTFGVGGVEVPNVEFLVGGSSLQGEMRTVGLLGRNLLAFYDTEYDLAHGQINLFKPKDCGGRPLAYWSTTAPSQLVMARTGDRDTSATAFVKVNGVQLRAVFDTGGSTSMLTLAGARRAGLDVHGPTAQPAGFTTGIGRRALQTWLVPVTAIQVGDETIKSTRMRVADYTIAGVDMIVGADFFLSHRVYVANGQKRIYFTYNGGPVFDLSVKPNAAPPPEPTPAAVLAQAEPPGAAPAGAPADAAKPAPPTGDEPKDADGYSRRGQAFAARRDYARALADLSRAVELAPQDARYLRQRAELRLATRQPFLAMTDLDAALKLAPDDAEAHVVRARLRASGRDRVGEEADLDAADRIAAKQADLRFALGGLFLNAERFDRAVAQFDQWLASHDGDARKPSALNGRCWARALANQDLDQAQRDCDAALRLQPRTAAFLDSRGLVKLRRGDLAGARADYDAALAIQPRIAFALYGRGVVKARGGDAAGSQADLAAATALDPQLPERAKRVGVTP